MIKLTPRLMAVAGLVRQGASLADIGCDHGFLPVYLLQNDLIKSAVASDVNEGPLSSCRQLVENNGFESRIRTVLSDGLKNIGSDDYTDVSFCGMGGELIASVLDASREHFLNNKHYIFNPMTHPEILRKYLCENGFVINNDFIVRENNHYYNVLDAYYTGEKTVYDDSYYFLGNITDFSHKEYFYHLLNHLENKMKGGADYSSVIAAVREKNMTTVKNIYDYINSVAPFDMAEQWDNSGFLAGDFRQEVKKAVVTLDVTKDVAVYAESIGADLIISHHPIIFGGVSSVKKGTALYTCVNNDISVISAHTNYDMAKNGINDNLCKILSLDDIKQIENSFISYGSLDYEMSIDDFAQYVADVLDVSGIRYTDTEKPIKTVAVGGGACEEYALLALQYADCFVTGDMKYHQMLDFAENDMAVISAGHFETEAIAFKMLMTDLQNLFSDVEFYWGNQKNPVHTI